MVEHPYLAEQKLTMILHLPHFLSQIYILQGKGRNIAICRVWILLPVLKNEWDLILIWSKVPYNCILYGGVSEVCWNIWKWRLTIWIMLLIRLEWIIKTRWVECWRCWSAVGRQYKGGGEGWKQLSATKWHGSLCVRKGRKSGSCWS
jgi:hypothetical protein